MKVLSLGAKLMESRPLSSFIDSPVWLKRDKPLIDRMGTPSGLYGSENALFQPVSERTLALAVESSESSHATTQESFDL